MTSKLPKKAIFSIALVNYKSLELTKTCLHLLHEALQGKGVPVVVVDNNSNDASSDYLKTLNWINLVERKNTTPEAGSIAHGRALDLALDVVDTEYLFLLHTDTFIYDPNIFSMMIGLCTDQREVAAVGCLEQLDRGIVRSAWRMASRFFKHYTRRSLLAIGVKARTPKPYRENHLKSFCTLWNVHLIKKHGLHFQMDDRNPGYELQDRMAALNYKIRLISPRKIFRYLDHIQSGTVSAMGGYSDNHRRVKMYHQITQEKAFSAHSVDSKITYYQCSKQKLLGGATIMKLRLLISKHFRKHRTH
ncbi:glycosyltransferase [Pseudomonas sp. PS01299]|uniref:glycosyltransferase family 2 protein n=1 Tax=Pseudomonas sp. PS01299 TaxID=2991435 RepID=UPI002499B16B|nr:glycosyltransferase [Pseudomonas sp. PS01299]